MPGALVFTTFCHRTSQVDQIELKSRQGASMRSKSLSLFFLVSPPTSHLELARRNNQDQVALHLHTCTIDIIVGIILSFPENRIKVCGQYRNY